MTNTCYAAILESVNDLTPSQLARQLKKMTPEQIREISGKIPSVIVGQLLSGKRKTVGGGRKPVMKLCEYCKKEMTARKLWAHASKCRRTHDKNAPPIGRPAGWRKGDGSYVGFKPTAT